MRKRIRKTVLLVLAAFFCAGLHAQNAVSLFNRGVQSQDDEDWYNASQYYLEVVRQNPAYADAWFRLSQCTYRLGEYDLALQYLENAEKYEKSSQKIQNHKGMLLLALDDAEGARQIFTEVLKNYPNDVDSHFGLAELELYEGRFSGAEAQYAEALKRQPVNRKALLSLAVLAAETGRFSQAEGYIRQAGRYYSGDAEVHYLAAVVYSMKGDYKNAEKQARIAVEIKEDYTAAYETLANVLYMQGRYEEVINLCDYLIGRDRKNSSAWYLKGISLEKQGKNDDAIEIWSAGLTVQPQDELMRMMLELTVRETLALDDGRRGEQAEYHVQAARQYRTRYDNAGAVYEYQRALLLDPMNAAAREGYAEILALNGMHELYLDQLRFLKEHNYKDTPNIALDDKIEAYESLLQKTLGKKWGIEPFYLDKTRWNIAVFYQDAASGLEHVDSGRLTALAGSDIFSGVAITSVKTQVTPASGFGEAFRNARSNGFDYFVLLSLSEGDDDLSLTSRLYSARTGLEVSENTFYSTGNNRFSVVLRRFRNSVLDMLPVRGKVLARNGKTVLLDVGKAESLVNGAELKIIRKGAIRTADNGAGIYYKPADVLGTVTVTDCGEEISEGLVSDYGFYDRINVDDEVVLVRLPEQASSNSAIDTVPSADETGTPVVQNEVKQDGADIIRDIRKAVEKPSIIKILHDIY